jgi:hypothetical protein
MGTEKGLDWRIHIGNNAEPEVFVPIGGEISFDWKRTSEEIDESTKDDGLYGATSYGQQKITFSINGNVKLPDVGLERAADVSKTAPPEANIKVMKGATVKYAGKVAIGNFSTSHPKNGPVTYSFDMANKGAPTTDDLGA